ncbi:MAG: hypothetical protein GY799_12230 [Desulfobulbaceae bacterium]|nr:hypothetical protein [Desulfobulbaceae bacterium]
MAGFGQTLRDETSIYHDGATVPQNTSVDGSSSITGINGQSGKIAIRCEPTVAVAVADATVLTLTLQHSTDNATWVTLDTFSTPSSGAKAFAIGELIHEFVLPRNSFDYTRVQLATTDAAATGTVDVFGNMVP